MRKALVILLLALLLLLCTPQAFKATALEQNPDGAVPQESPPERGIDSYSEGEDDIFSSSYERELLSRRFFQKTLAPLSRREKIAWAFKTSQASILL
jgi:hypothetical protein